MASSAVPVTRGCTRPRLWLHQRSDRSTTTSGTLRAGRDKALGRAWWAPSTIESGSPPKGGFPLPSSPDVFRAPGCPSRSPPGARRYAYKVDGIRPVATRDGVGTGERMDLIVPGAAVHSTGLTSLPRGFRPAEGRDASRASGSMSSFSTSGRNRVTDRTSDRPKPAEQAKRLPWLPPLAEGSHGNDQCCARYRAVATAGGRSPLAEGGGQSPGSAGN
jgi:hypothetical protein